MKYFTLNQVIVIWTHLSAATTNMIPSKQNLKRKNVNLLDLIEEAKKEKQKKPESLEYKKRIKLENSGNKNLSNLKEYKETVKEESTLKSNNSCRKKYASNCIEAKSGSSSSKNFDYNSICVYDSSLKKSTKVLDLKDRSISRKRFKDVPCKAEQIEPYNKHTSDSYVTSNLSSTSNECDIKELRNDTKVTLKKVVDSRDIPDRLYVALDCEMVGVGIKGRESRLARCSIVGYDGSVIYNSFIRPEEPITDYRTPWSGVTPRHMASAVPIELAVQEITDIIQNKIVIGHSLHYDFKVIGFKPLSHRIRDISGCKMLIEMQDPSVRAIRLRTLTFNLLGRTIQQRRSGHCSLEDSLAALDLFKLVRENWEKELFARWTNRNIDLANDVQEMLSKEDNDDFLADRYWDDSNGSNNVTDVMSSPCLDLMFDK